MIKNAYVLIEISSKSTLYFNIKNKLKLDKYLQNVQYLYNEKTFFFYCTYIAVRIA